MRIHFDTHGHINTFPKYPHSNIQAGRNLIKSLCGEDIHLGDLGFDYTMLTHLKKDSFILIGGNHDNYDSINSIEGYLGDWGAYNFHGLEFFYVRGENSIDKEQRAKSGPNKSWWEQEQITYEQMSYALEAYSLAKPKVVLTHGAPKFLHEVGVLKSAHIGVSPSMTSKLFEMMWNIHEPEWWFFGHWHQNVCRVIRNTVFYCGEELQYVDVSVDNNGNLSVGPVT